LSPKTSVCEKRNREPKDRRAHDQVGCNTGTSNNFTPTASVVGLRVAALRWPFGGYRELEGGPLAEWRRRTPTWRYKAHAWQEPHYLLSCIVWWTSPDGALPPCHTLCGCDPSCAASVQWPWRHEGRRCSAVARGVFPSPPPCIVCMHVVRPQRVLPLRAPRRALRSRQLSISSTHAARASMRRPAVSTPTPGTQTR